MNQEEFIMDRKMADEDPAGAGACAENEACPGPGIEAETPGLAGEEDALARLRAELEAERGARQAAEDQALRFRADFENLRRRAALEAEQLRFGLTQDLVGRFLPILDDLERALQSMAKEAAPAWLSGVEMVQRRFLAALQDLGLARVEAVGQPFDPEKHEAMLCVEDSGQPSGTIVEELRSGFLLGERVIRPALVKVQA